MYKLKSVLRGNTQDHVAALESQILINANEEMFHKQTPDSLEILLESIAQKTVVKLQYQSPYKDSITERTIEPIGLVHENHYWYVMAYCQLRADYRQFRTDRMLRLQRTDEPFSREHPTAAELQQAQSDSHKTKVVIRVSKEVVRYIKTGRKYYGFVSEKDLGERVEMTFMTHNTYHCLARWYLMFGDCAEIVEPESFREEVLEIINQSVQNLAEPIAS